MIKSLRIRFVAVAFSIVTIVVAALVTVINVTSSVSSTEQADAIIDSLVKKDPLTGEYFVLDEKSFNDRAPDGREPAVPQDESFSPPDEPGSPDVPPDGRVPRNDTILGARYFSATVGTDGSIQSVDISKIAEIGDSSASEQKARDLVEKTLKNNEKRAYSGTFRYSVFQNDNGEKFIIFLDRAQQAEENGELLERSLLLGFASLVVLFVIIFFLSKSVLAPVERAYDKQKRFITDASHDLKTPLTVISADTEILEMEIGENEWLSAIKSQVEKLSSLTKNLVTLARMDETGYKPVKSDFSITDAFMETVSPFVSAANAKSLTLTIDADKNLSYYGNEDSIRQALSLLLDNAVKYAEKGEIKASLKRVGKSVVISTENFCDDLPDGDNSVLFDRFYRGDRSRNQKKSGNGIGLSVVKAVVESHGGKVSCTKTDDKITFKIIL